MHVGRRGGTTRHLACARESLMDLGLGVEAPAGCDREERAHAFDAEVLGQRARAGGTHLDELLERLRGELAEPGVDEGGAGREPVAFGRCDLGECHVGAEVRREALGVVACFGVSAAPGLEVERQGTAAIGVAMFDRRGELEPALDRGGGGRLHPERHAHLGELGAPVVRMPESVPDPGCERHISTIPEGTGDRLRGVAPLVRSVARFWGADARASTGQVVGRASGRPRARSTIR